MTLDGMNFYCQGLGFVPLASMARMGWSMGGAFKSCGPVKTHFGSPFFWVKYWEDGGFKLGGGFRYFLFSPENWGRFPI